MSSALRAIWRTMVWTLVVWVWATGARAAESDAPAEASLVEVTTRLSPEPSSVGDLLTYEVQAVFPRGVTVNLPRTLRLDPLHVVSTQERETEATGEGLRKLFVLELQHFGVGDATVPAFELTSVDPQGSVQAVAVPSKAFRVEALLANEVDPERKREDPPISLEYPHDLAETIIYSALATLLVVLLVLPFILRWMRRDVAAVVPPPPPAHEIAYGALSELKRGELLDAGRYQDYYVQLTEIAKGYLERRFGVDALDRTTEEIRRIAVARPQAFAPLQTDEVVRFLQECDLVKFARMQPSTDDALEALESVWTMVDQSKIEAEKHKPAPLNVVKVDSASGATERPAAASSTEDRDSQVASDERNRHV